MTNAVANIILRVRGKNSARLVGIAEHALHWDGHKNHQLTGCSFSG